MPERPAAPPPPAGGGAGYRSARPAWQLFRRVPATVCFLAAVWAAGLVTGSIAHGPPRWLSGQVSAVPSLRGMATGGPRSARGCGHPARAATWP